MSDTVFENPLKAATTAAAAASSTKPGKKTLPPPLKRGGSSSSNTSASAHGVLYSPQRPGSEPTADAKTYLVDPVGVAYDFSSQGAIFLLVGWFSIMPWLFRVPPIFLVLPGLIAPSIIAFCVFPGRYQTNHSGPGVDDKEEIEPPHAVPQNESCVGRLLRRVWWTLRSDAQDNKSDDVFTLARLLCVADDIADLRLNHWMPCVMICGHLVIVVILAIAQTFQRSITDCITPPCDTLPGFLMANFGNHEALVQFSLATTTAVYFLTFSICTAATMWETQQRVVPAIAAEKAALMKRNPLVELILHSIAHQVEAHMKEHYASMGWKVRPKAGVCVTQAMRRDVCACTAICNAPRYWWCQVWQMGTGIAYGVYFVIQNVITYWANAWAPTVVLMSFCAICISTFIWHMAYVLRSFVALYHKNRCYMRALTNHGIALECDDNAKLWWELRCFFLTTCMPINYGLAEWGFAGLVAGDFFFVAIIVVRVLLGGFVVMQYFGPSLLALSAVVTTALLFVLIGVAVSIWNEQVGHIEKIRTARLRLLHACIAPSSSQLRTVISTDEDGGRAGTPASPGLNETGDDDDAAPPRGRGPVDPDKTLEYLDALEKYIQEFDSAPTVLGISMKPTLLLVLKVRVVTVCRG